jgi:Na+/proline symporter
VVSYLGWVAAQIKALGLLFFTVTEGGVSVEAGMVLGTALVLTYTVFGGMFSVAILDFVQMIVMLGGLLFVAWVVSEKVGGGATAVIDHASQAGKFSFFPPADPWLWLTFIGTGVTMMFGSIPQQDVFQRVTSAKSAKIALWGSVAGAALYFSFTFVPMFIAYSATMIDPVTFGDLLESNAELIVPTLVKNYTPLLAQVLFYGAVLSAIMSTASATLLAPSVTFSENIIRGLIPALSDRQFLRVMRFSLMTFAGMVLAFALYSEASIFKMVENAYKITLAGAFVPLIAGILWSRATSQGALAAIFGGLLSWILIEVLVAGGDQGGGSYAYATFGKDGIPPQLIGLLVSAIGMVAGSLLPQWIGHRMPGRPLHELHHLAARETHHTAHVSEHPHHH